MSARQSVNPIVMIIAERGSDWVAFAERLRSRQTPAQQIVVVQGDDETDEAFALRVIGKQKALRIGGGTLCDVAVLVRGRTRTALAARNMMVRSLLAESQGRLFLDESHQPFAARALARALRGQGNVSLVAGPEDEALNPRTRVA